MVYLDTLVYLEGHPGGPERYPGGSEGYQDTVTERYPGGPEGFRTLNTPLVHLNTP